MNKLAIEALLSAQPGVIDLSFDRSDRGAILQLRAVVSDEKAARDLRETVASAIGSRFADERLVIVTQSKPEPASKSKVAPPALEPKVEPIAPLGLAAADRGALSERPPSLPRIRLTQVASNVRPGETRIEVTLEAGDRVRTAGEGGPSFSGSSLRLAALATVSAVRRLDPEFDVKLDHVSNESISGERIVFVALAVRFADRSDEGWKRLHGVASVGDGTPEAAAARAILSTLNRVLS